MNHQLEKMNPELLDWQEKKRQDYLKINEKESPEIIFIGDSITDFFPLKQLIQTDRPLSNRGVAGYISEFILDYFPIHIFGNQLNQVFLLIGTNDIGMGIEEEEILENVTKIIDNIQKLYPSVNITILSVLPVNEGSDYASRVKMRKNRNISSLNRAYQRLIEQVENVNYLDVASVLKDENGQLEDSLTTDGLHLTQKGYEKIAKVINRALMK